MITVRSGPVFLTRLCYFGFQFGLWLHLVQSSQVGVCWFVVWGGGWDVSPVRKGGLVGMEFSGNSVQQNIT
jgi:hypothetical protein